MHRLRQETGIPAKAEVYGQSPGVPELARNDIVQSFPRARPLAPELAQWT